MPDPAFVRALPAPEAMALARETLLPLVSSVPVAPAPMARREEISDVLPEDQRSVPPETAMAPEDPSALPEKASTPPSTVVPPE